VVRCFGLCVVAAQGSPPAQRGASPGTAAPVPVAFRSWTPWLVTATLPATPKLALLRYNVAYDARWIALAGLVTLPHVRIDTVVNGWIAPPAPVLRPIVLLEVPALLQAVLEVIGALYALGVAATCVKGALRGRAVA
jgi:hypothetical protein